MSPLDTQFHIQQQRIGKTVVRGRKPSPRFFESAAGDASWYEVPAYLRQRIHQHDFDNRCRIASYVDRVQASIQRDAA